MKYVPNLKLLDTYSDVKNHVDAPMVAVFEFDDKKLIYCGTGHDMDASFQTIDRCFRDFDIDCVVSEYDKNKALNKTVGKIKTENELEYAVLVGLQKGIDVVLADTGEKDWIMDLLKINLDYVKQLQVFFMLDDAYKYKKYFHENFSIKRAMANVVDKYWDNDFPRSMTESEFKDYFLREFGFEITDENISDIFAQHPDWNEPNMDGGLINKLWAAINLYSRDPYMLKCIFDSVNTHNCVFATFGAGHFDDQRRVLENSFGKPKFTNVKG